MKYDGRDLVKCRWASHQFAIISVPAFNESTNGRENWKNASGEVYEVLNEIWKAEGY
jgi:hypothetical protein